MKSASGKVQNFTITDENMTFGNIQIPNNYAPFKPSLKELYSNKNFSPSEFSSALSEVSKLLRNNEKIPELAEDVQDKSGFEKASDKENIPVKRFSNVDLNLLTSSDDSFSHLIQDQKHKSSTFDTNFHSLSLNLSKPLRIFNKHGKPLTDRMGRPLEDIMGQSLVVFDEKGRLISDSKGNQIFNCCGESAVFSNTDLFKPPSQEELGGPLFDADKKHILFLYDNKGHPLTDCLGRPLVRDSGSLMFGMSQKEYLDFEKLKINQLKNMYGKAPLENCVRHIQIFDADLKPLTTENGTQLKNATIFCNENGMPVCDGAGRPCSFKYGSRVIVSKKQSCAEFKNINCALKMLNELKDIKFNNQKELEESCSKEEDQSEESIYKMESGISSISPIQKTETNDFTQQKREKGSSIKNTSEIGLEKEISRFEEFSRGTNITNNENVSQNAHNNKLNNDYNSSENEYESNRNKSKEAVTLFDASNRLGLHKSAMNTVVYKTLQSRRKKKVYHREVKRKVTKPVAKANLIEYFKNAVPFVKSRQHSNIIYNDYGKPVTDLYGNLLYDKYGIPLTGANGTKLSDQARRALRLKLRNIPVVPIRKLKQPTSEDTGNVLTYNGSRDKFGQPYYDKHGRPLYDSSGKLIYDIYGRPLTDAFDRPLIDAIGQPLMDSEGNVLTSVTCDVANADLKDVFGRRLYDKRGRPLFDSYGRPRFDIFTKAIYDNCGRPATDGNGNTLYDFLNQPIQPYPEKPLYKNVRAFLPKYVDTILMMPSMQMVMKYSRASLKDVYGGPLFDDFGRPMYNKVGKPMYDRYGRPLYDKDGRPLCDCYGRPVSEEIRRSTSDMTVSVVDSLKLLKLTKESSKWMEIKKSEMTTLRNKSIKGSDKTTIMQVVNPTREKSTKYIYALTRVTVFDCGRQALEILEAPLSPATASEMHHLPVDNKPVIMMARRRQRVSTKHKPLRHK